MKYNRDISELKSNAALWWPKDLQEKNSLANVLPALLKTQEDFLCLLRLSKKDPFSIFKLIESSGYAANFFLKHLCVLADYGGEPIQRLGKSFAEIFHKDETGYHFTFAWDGKEYLYRFKKLPITGLGNKKLSIDGEGLTKEKPLDGLLTDMIAILMFSAASSVADHAGLKACDIGSLLGNATALESFVKQRYIMVSRITGGATANSLGQLAQTELVDFLNQQLGDRYQVKRNGAVNLKKGSKTINYPFDIVVSKGKKMVGIEVSFQVTTNSTIERKAAQAEDRKLLMHENGHLIAYVIDGAGNFQRSSAISVICSNSDCTVAYSTNEFEVLAQWILRKL